VTGVSLEGVDCVMFVGVDAAKTVSLRVYYVDMKVDDEHSSVPRVELVPMGPDIDWALRRTHLASHDLEKLAMRVPSQCVRAAAAASARIPPCLCPPSLHTVARPRAATARPAGSRSSA